MLASSTTPTTPGVLRRPAYLKEKQVKKPEMNKGFTPIELYYDRGDAYDLSVTLSRDDEGDPAFTTKFGGKQDIFGIEPDSFQRTSYGPNGLDKPIEMFKLGAYEEDAPLSLRVFISMAATISEMQNEIRLLKVDRADLHKEVERLQHEVDELESAAGEDRHNQD